MGGRDPHPMAPPRPLKSARHEKRCITAMPLQVNRLQKLWVDGFVKQGQSSGGSIRTVPGAIQPGWVPFSAVRSGTARPGAAQPSQVHYSLANYGIAQPIHHSRARYNPAKYITAGPGPLAKKKQNCERPIWPTSPSLSCPALCAGGWRVTDGGWRVTDGGWRVSNDGWRVSDGGWRASDGGWRVSDGGWTKEESGSLNRKKKNCDRPYGTPWCSTARPGAV